MRREAESSADEFRLLLDYPQLTDQQHCDGELGRAASVVNWVRNAVHDYHLGRKQGILSTTMQSVLPARERKWICPLCRRDL